MDESFDPLNIPIVTQYDGAGAEAAKADMTELGAGADTAGAALGKMGEGAKKLGEEGEKLSYHTLREAAHAAHGVEVAAEGGHMSLLRMAMSARALFALLTGNPLIAFATAIGAVVIALGVWMKKTAEARAEISKDLDEVLKKNTETASEIAKTNSEMQFSALKTALEDIKTLYSGVNTEAKELLEHQIAMKREAKELALANLDAEEQKALAGAQGDPVKEKEIQRDFAARKLALKEHSGKEETALQSAAAKKAMESASSEYEARKAVREKIETAAGNESDNYAAAQGNVRNLIAATGVRSEQEIKLERLAELRKKGSSRSKKDALEMLDLTEQEESLKTAAQEAPTFDKKTTERLKTKAARQYESGADENAVTAAKSAQSLLDLGPQLPKLKEIAERAENEKEKQVAELDKEQKETLQRYYKAQSQHTELEARSKTQAAQAEDDKLKTKTTTERAVQEALLGEEKKALEAKINAAEAALEGADKTGGDYGAKVDALAKLKASAVGLRLPGAKPTQAESDLEAADKAKIAADAQRQKEAADKAREQEAERAKKEWEKAHGPEVEGEAHGAAQHAAGLASGGFNSDRLVQQASEAMQKGPLNHSNQQALIDALQKLIATMGMGDDARKKEAGELVNQIRQLEQKTNQLEQKIKENRTP